MIKEVLDIQDRVSSIQHQLAKCNHLSISTMPDEKILCNVDELVKSRKSPFSVIPAKAGIQRFRNLA